MLLEDHTISMADNKKDIAQEALKLHRIAGKKGLKLF
jgi:hypothetical protein